MSKMNEPPPDILMTSHYNHRSNSNNHSIQDEGGLQNFGYSESEDWEMILDSPETCSEEAAVDIVIRQQPGHDGSLINLSPEEPQGNDTSTSSFYRNARRMVVHQIQGVDVAKPTCGNCCILQWNSFYLLLLCTHTNCDIIFKHYDTKLIRASLMLCCFWTSWMWKVSKAVQSLKPPSIVKDSRQLGSVHLFVVNSECILNETIRVN